LGIYLLLASLGLGISYYVLTIALQEIRGKLFRILFEHARHLSSQFSDWTGGGNKPYLHVFKREALWGQMADQIYSIEPARAWMTAARALDVSRKGAAALSGLCFVGAFLPG
jgi:hypothetical protein